jgi:hypothetical protein
MRWALALPVLFALWVNTHGGVLAGLAVLVVTAAGGVGAVVLAEVAGLGSQGCRWNRFRRDLLWRCGFRACCAPAPCWSILTDGN